MDDDTVKDRLRRLAVADPPVVVDHARVLQVGRRRRLARRAGTAAAAFALVAAGVPAVAMLTPDPSPPPIAGQPSTSQTETTQGPSASDGSMDDAAICIAFGDVLTIVENADLGLASGRMEDQERLGWYGLATRVLDRLPSSGGSAVRDAIAELQEIAPAVPAGAYAESRTIRSEEWNDAQQQLGAACDDVDASLAISVFTDG